MCTKCNCILYSIRTHDFITCKCGNLSVDGGKSYLKRCCVDIKYVIDLSIVEFKSKEDEDAV